MEENSGMPELCVLLTIAIADNIYKKRDEIRIITEIRGEISLPTSGE
jgi:hypothetical protein